MMLFGHILFGTMALIGAFLLEVGFRKDFQELNLIQRLGIIFTKVQIIPFISLLLIKKIIKLPSQAHKYTFIGLRK